MIKPVQITVIALLLSACAPRQVDIISYDQLEVTQTAAAAPQPGEPVQADQKSQETPAPTPTEALSTPAASEPADAPAEPEQAAPPAALPAWQTLPLTDARTGETFTLADFSGKTVFVEPMATWCTNCRAQLGNVSAAQQNLGDDVVFVALSVETNITSSDLAAYADANNFGWTFAVMTPELLAELVTAYGRTITNPPSTPHFIIYPDGTTSELSTGVHSADEIIQQVQAAGG